MPESKLEKFQWYLLTGATALLVTLIGWWATQLSNRVNALEEKEPVAIVNSVRLDQAINDIAEIKIDVKAIMAKVNEK